MGIIGHQWDVNGIILGQQWMGSLVISWNCHELPDFFFPRDIIYN